MYNKLMKNIDIVDNSGKLFYIGGVVRDELLGRESFDIDIVFEGDAIEYCSNFGEVIRVNPDFGTVRVKVGDVEVDFASTRSESYPRPGHLPVVEKIGCSLKEDVLRRDFTINSLAKSLTSGEIVDFTGGLNDLKNGLLRVLHEKSFIDDPTRIIRALKFSVRFGFDLEEATRTLQNNYLKNINYDMCYKRIKKELMETFNLNSQEAFERFYDEGIYKLVSSETVLRPKVNAPDIIKPFNIKNPWIVYVAGINLSNIELTRQEQKFLNDFVNLKDENLDSDFKIYKIFSQLSPESIAMYGVWVSEEPIVRYLKIKDIKVLINGNDLKAMGIPPSKKYIEIFDKVLDAKLKNPSMGKDDELELVRKLFVF